MAALDSRVTKSLERLLDKSRKDEVVWRETREDGFIVDMGASGRLLQVQVDYWSPDALPDSAEVSILFEGREVFRDHAIDGTEAFELYRSLYEEARRSIVGWDKALELLDSEVAKQGVIGTRPKQEVDASAYEVSGDVPF